MRHIRTNIYNPVSFDRTDFLPDHVISISGGKIVAICPFSKHDGPWEDHRHHVALPGFIDLHVHLSQYRIRGLYQPALLPWLEKNVFPEEARSVDPDYAAKLSRDFYRELLKSGTTYSVIYTAGFHQAAEAAFLQAQDMGIRCKIGMTMMDMNSPKELQQSTDYALKHSIALHQKWQDPFLGYIFTPRFAPTCSEILMRETAAYAREHKAFIQTHLSENPDEIAWVKEIFGRDSYTAVYEDFGLLGPRTILGHAIHLSAKELSILADHRAAIAHCPDSNFYLKSGEFPLRRISQSGIRFALGSDVGAGSSLNMLFHAKLMNYRQSSDPILASEMLYRITLASAEILELENRIGSLDPGKDADLILLEPPAFIDPSQQSLDQIIFLTGDFKIRRVIVLGKDMLKED